MTEELISFDTAKLAKEKGFNEECRFYYEVNSGEYTFHTDFEPYTNSEIENGYGKLKYPMLSAPTQSLLQKWLREVHEIEVNPNQNFTKGGIKMQYNISIESYKHNHLGKYVYGNTYEEVLEIGLQEGLKLIK